MENKKPNLSELLLRKAIKYHSAEETSQVTTTQKDFFFNLSNILVKMMIAHFVLRFCESQHVVRCLLQKERVSGYEEELCSGGARVVHPALARSSSSVLL